LFKGTVIAEFKQGLVIGLAVSVPVGPIALLIIRRSLRDGKTAGFVSGLGAASADALCGGIAALGLSAITALIEHNIPLLRLIGGILLICFGLHIVRSHPPLDVRRPVHERSLLRAYLTTGALTLANPMTFLAMTFVSAAAGVGAKDLTMVNAGCVVLGIFASAGAWWLLISGSAGFLGKRLSNETLHTMNMIAGAIIIGLGAYQLAELMAKV
jgi:threonine/homoserine/homoserine lactone efflux protein